MNDVVSPGLSVADLTVTYRNGHTALHDARSEEHTSELQSPA